MPAPKPRKKKPSPRAKGGLTRSRRAASGDSIQEPRHSASWYTLNGKPFRTRAAGSSPGQKRAGYRTQSQMMKAFRGAGRLRKAPRGMPLSPREPRIIARPSSSKSEAERAAKRTMNSRFS
jgi:hypothetical protein